MKKSFVPIIILGFFSVAWLGGWASDRLVQNLIISGKLSSAQNTAPKSGTSPTSCGVGATVTTGSADIAGGMILGPGSITSCKITFDSAWANAPFCVIYATGSTAIVATTDTTAIFMSSTQMQTYKVNWHCIGY